MRLPRYQRYVGHHRKADPKIDGISIGNLHPRLRGRDLNTGRMRVNWAPIWTYLAATLVIILILSSAYFYTFS